MERKRLAFLANSFHLERTKSADFLIELLKRHFDVTIVPHKRAWLEVPGKRYDILLPYQHLYTPHELEAFGVPKVVLVPMYDDCPKDIEFWKQYRQFSVLAFSSALASILDEAGVPNLRTRYYPREAASMVLDSSPNEGIRAFFWQRVPQITWEGVVKPLLGKLRPSKFYFHAVPDPGFESFLPSAADMQEYNISVSKWFENPKELAQILRSCNLYFAPRLLEGIGTSFLEALSLGLCVVAPNLPTMNEYISNGVDGILYDPSGLESIDDYLSLAQGQLQKLGLAARVRTQSGRLSWEQQEQDISNFFAEASKYPLKNRKWRGIFLCLRAVVVDLGRKVKRLGGRNAMRT